MTMADAIAVMNGGRIEQLGTPAELYERPRDRVRRRVPRRLEPPRGTVSGDGRPSGSTAGREVRVAPERARRAHRRRRRRDPPGEDASSAAAEANALEGRSSSAAYVGVSTQYVVDDRTRPSRPSTSRTRSPALNGAARASA